jgi:hypothetical protein
MGYGGGLLIALGLGAIARALGLQNAAGGLVTGGVASVGLRVLVDQLPSVAGRAGLSDYVGSGLGFPELDYYRAGGISDYTYGS